MASGEILLESGTNELEIIEFYVLSGARPGESERHHFGINVAKVLEVIENPGLAPGRSSADPSFMGAIPLREKVLPVIDLSVWLGIDRVVASHEVVLVTEFNNTVVGFLASGVTQIYRVAWSDVEGPGKFLSSFEKACVTGIVHFEDHSLLMLDLESFMAAYIPLDRPPGLAGDAGAVGPDAHTALVVDDSRMMRQVMSDHLAGSSFRVVTATNGEEAWELLARRNKPCQEGAPQAEGLEPIDIVVSDIEMPRMDGLALTRRIKSDPELRRLPVVLFSSLITESLRHKGESVGADLQISKPEFSELAARAGELVRLSREGRGR